MTQELQGVIMLLAVLTILAMLVKHEKRVARWLSRRPRHR
jgi:hypothetical protein